MSCNTCPDGHVHPDENREAVALLRYMIDHNKHHTDELYDLAGKLDGDAKQLVHAAVIQYEQGTDKLEQALKAMGEAVL